MININGNKNNNDDENGKCKYMNNGDVNVVIMITKL